MHKDRKSGLSLRSVGFEAACRMHVLSASIAWRVNGSDVRVSKIPVIVLEGNSNTLTLALTCGNCLRIIFSQESLTCTRFNLFEQEKYFSDANVKLCLIG